MSIKVKWDGCSDDNNSAQLCILLFSVSSFTKQYHLLLYRATSYTGYQMSKKNNGSWCMSEIYRYTHSWTCWLRHVNIATYACYCAPRGSSCCYSISYGAFLCSSTSGFDAYGKQKGKTILFYVKYTMQGIWSFFCWYASIDFMMYVYVI